MSIKKYIPSLFTSLNLASGFIAILLNDPFISPLLILFGAFLDVFDGAIARKLNATSLFGAELDSLSDVVTFGIAPAFLYYNHILLGHYNQFLSIAVVSILSIFGAIRLAKFNIDTEQSNNFKGMPIPSAGLFIAFIVLEKYFNSYINFELNKYIWLILPLIIAYLMVSPTTFISVKKSNSKKKKILQIILIIIFSIALIIGILTKLPLIPAAFIIYIFISFIFCKKDC